MKFKFPVIRQFREVLRQYVSKGICGKVTILGYPKAHGVNGSILFTSPTEYEVHSKEAEIIPPMTLHGFEEWVADNIDYLRNTAEVIRALCPLYYPFVIAGEWAGGSIQRKSSVNGLPKFFMVVAIGNVCEEIDPQEGPFNAIQFQQLPPFSLTNPEVGIYDKRSFGCYKLELDISFPELMVNQLGDLTKEVEAACPIAKYFGVDSDKGEGIVWQAESNIDRHLFFKVKGAKHSVSKVRVLASVNAERINSILEFVEYACTENRMEQALSETGPVMKESMSSFIKWMCADIIKEESDTLTNNGIDFKDVQQRVANKCIAWYKTKLQQ